MCLASILGGSLRVQNTVAAYHDTGLQELFLALVPRSQQLPGHHPHGEDEDEVDDLQGLLLH